MVYVCVKDSSPDITLTDGSTKPMNLVGSVGALVGVVANSGSEYAIIDQCYADSSVNLVGGRTALIGCGNKTTNFVVSNCYAYCASTQFKGTKGTNAAGTDDKEWDNNVGNRFMLVSGNGAKPTVSSCYSYGNITNNGNFDKTVGGVNNVYYYDGWAGDSYATAVSGNAIKGSGAASLMPNLDWTKFETREGMRPVLSVFTTHNLGTDGAVWDGSADSQLVDNDGDGYLDINTVRNSEWRGTSEAHYNSDHAFTIDNYDVDGNYVSSSESNLNALGMGKQTWFANDPVHSSIKITQRGTVELTGMRSKYMYDVIPEGYKDYAYPGQNSDYWNLGDSEFTVTDIVYPER